MTQNIDFKVTPTQKETIELRAVENGFDDARSYIKVVALKSAPFVLTSAGTSDEEPSISLGFEVSESQKSKIEANMKESNCEDLATYLRYVALHGVVNAVVEVRSTGKLDDMLQRIAESRKAEKPRRLF